MNGWPELASVAIAQSLEAGAGIEPANSGFADRDLTTWLPRRVESGQYRCRGACIKRRASVNALTLQRFRLPSMRDKVGRTICSRTETHPRRRKFAGARVSQCWR